jgi:hypothetical protein
VLSVSSSASSLRVARPHRAAVRFRARTEWPRPIEAVSGSDAEARARVGHSAQAARLPDRLVGRAPLVIAEALTMITPFSASHAASRQSLETEKGEVRPFIARPESGPLNGPNRASGRTPTTFCNDKTLSYSAANSAGAEGPGNGPRADQDRTKSGSEKNPINSEIQLIAVAGVGACGGGCGLQQPDLPVGHHWSPPRCWRSSPPSMPAIPGLGRRRRSASQRSRPSKAARRLKFANAARVGRAVMVVAASR